MSLRLKLDREVVILILLTYLCPASILPSGFRAQRMTRDFLWGFRNFQAVFAVNDLWIITGVFVCFDAVR